jgi:hypothetical protein
MISIRKIFENFMTPWHGMKFKVRIKKKKLPGLPLTPNRGSLGRIKKMNSRLSTITKPKR